MKPANSILRDTAVFVASLMKNKLPKNLVYHTIRHTREIVLNVKEISAAMKLSNDEIIMMEIAAWFHDIGYVSVYSGHERAGITIARKFLAEHRFPISKIKIISGCIRATKMPQSPHNIYENILCDADVLNAGTDTFFEKSERIRKEWFKSLGIKYSNTEWLQHSLSFLNNLQFHTSYVRKVYNGKRKANIILLEAMIKAESEKSVHLFQ